MKRVFLFLLTNIAIMLVIGIVVNVLGLNQWMTQKGIDYGMLFGFSLVIGFSGSFISLWISKWMAIRAYNIQIIEQPSNSGEEWLVETIRAQSKKIGIPMPSVGIYASPEVNAFATGPSKKNSLVAVSSGLLQGMSKREVEGVLAHEVAHIANGDMVTMTLLQGVLNTFVVFLSRILGMFIDSALRKNADEESSSPGLGYYIGYFICEILLGVLASLVVMRYSRWREFRADADAVKIWGKEPMIEALKRLNAIMNTDPIFDNRSDAVSAFKISGKPSGFVALFSSHPPLEERIAALERLR
jgi:heat shock protein HtpX